MILNVKVTECWKCKNDYLIAYFEDDSIPVGPSFFTERQIDLAKDNGVIIEMVHSKTMNSDYEACVCPHCNAFLGEFFYHDYTYIPGDIQIHLNESDEILKTVINNELELREHNGYDVEVEKKKLELEIKELEEKLKRSKRNQIFSDFHCVRVKFENGKNYPYNCPFDVKIGDIVYVEGKLQGVKGKVVKIQGKWQKYKTMQEVIKVEKHNEANENE